MLGIACVALHCIHPSVIYAAYLLRVTVKLELIPADFGEKWGQVASLS